MIITIYEAYENYDPAVNDSKALFVYSIYTVDVGLLQDCFSFAPSVLEAELLNKRHSQSTTDVRYHQTYLNSLSHAGD